MDVSKLPYHHPVPWDAPLRPATLPAMLEEAAIAAHDAPLVAFMGRRYSYGEIWRQARRFAAGLQARGIGQGDRVGLFLPNVPIYPIAYYGAMLAGATVVNFSPLYTVEELAHQVQDAGVRLLVTVDVAALYPTARRVLETSGLEALLVGRLADMLPRAKGWALRLLGRARLARPDFGDTVWRWADLLPDSEPDRVAIGLQDTALLQYTGGTTGRPKGAMLTHANLTMNARQADAIDPFGEGHRDLILGALPLFHVFANTCVLNRTVARHGCIAMVPRFDAGEVLTLIDRVRPTAFPGVPTMYQALMDHPAFAKTDFSSLRICISGGAPLPDKLRDAFEGATGVRLVEGYGLTESSGVVSANPYEGRRKPGSIGQVLPGTRILLLDKEDPARLAPEGQPGELAVNGPQIMKGYWSPDDADRTDVDRADADRANADRDVFVEHDGRRWLRTGDVARLGADGFLEIVDRLKDMIAVGGFKVFPSQVEDVLLRHPAVKEALVIGVPDDYRGEMPRAYVTRVEGAHDGADALAAWLNQRVGKHERVDSVVIRADLPKTMIGKLDRKALRAQVLD